MKKTFITLGLVAVLGLTAVSCSADDTMITDEQANELANPKPGIIIDNGDRDLPKPPIKF